MNVNEVSIDGVEPITLKEARRQCYIPVDEVDTDVDMLLSSFIRGARRHGEGVTWRSLVDKTLELRMDEFPRAYEDTHVKRTHGLHRNIIELPYGPIISVESVKYMLNGTEHTVSSSDYTVDTNSTPGRIEPINFWPNTDDVIDAVRIRYKTGYQDSGGVSNVPDDIKIALLMMVKFLYDNRDSHVLVERSGEYHEAPIGTNLILEHNSLSKFA